MSEKLVFSDVQPTENLKLSCGAQKFCIVLKKIWVYCVVIFYLFLEFRVKKQHLETT